ncbi:hypothetical protein L226DRAFT_570822 [Lentinus tigrinus ALCF2SS1-7]|uniref:uncharacterized protein n=1 Tax=Lentinus tigrinus ALCF2SS1-7 TaxID=1328758 RepID=UPI0011663171|nr:hypothetical protein L226DRAFT_570822 [Lentinus tigrinus ALCF2SS1-7]
MADERTASNFTWYNSAIRNRQDVKTLTNMIQVRQWYLNESVPPRTHPVVRWSKLTPSVLASREKPLHPNDDIFEDWPADVDPRAAPSHSVETAPMASDFSFEDMYGLFDLSSSKLWEIEGQGGLGGGRRTWNF